MVVFGSGLRKTTAAMVVVVCWVVAVGSARGRCGFVIGNCILCFRLLGVSQVTRKTAVLVVPPFS